MRLLPVGGICAALLASSLAADAVDEACLNAASQGQVLRDAHSLIESRDQFRICVRGSCPGVVKKDCARWLEEVERIIPTVVFTVKDAKGRDVLDVRASENGRLLTGMLDGMAIAMNPGRHTFRFDLPDDTSIELHVVVPEGQKAFPVTANAVTPVASVGTKASKAPGPLPQPMEPAPVASRSRIPEYAMLGVGATGLVVGMVFGLRALGNKSSLDRDCADKTCPSSSQWDIDGMHTNASVSTAGFAVGVLGVAIGAALFLTSKPDSVRADSVRPHSVRADSVRPWVGIGAVGIDGKFQ